MNIVQNFHWLQLCNPSGLHRSVEKKNASLLSLHPVRDASLQDARGMGAMPVSTDRCIPTGCVLTSTKYTHYCGNYVFETGVDDKLLTDNGYYSGGKYYFYSKDYLGNIVATVRVDSIGHNASVVQATHYYPFGLPMAISTGANVQKYKYSGKEFDTEHGLMEYDFGARTYDAQTGRFTGFDPMAESRPWESPYSYCGNNPVNRIDPSGMIWWDTLIAELLKQAVAQKIAALQQEIANFKQQIAKLELSDKKNKISKLEEEKSNAEGRILHLETSIKDIDRLGADQDNIYTFSHISGGEHHVVLGEDSRVYIETSSVAISLHEISHVRQSLDAGGLKFSEETNFLRNAADTEPMKFRYERMSANEVEGYQIQYSYNEKSFPGAFVGGKGLKGINVHSVGNLSNNGILIYKYIYEYSKFLEQREEITKGRK